VGQTAGAEEADPLGLGGVSQQSDDALGQVPAPHVHVLVEVVPVNIRQRYPLPVQLYVGVDREVGLTEGQLVRGDVPLLQTGLGGQAGKLIVGILVLVPPVGGEQPQLMLGH